MNSAIYIIYIFCSAFLFLVMFLSGSSKFIQGRPTISRAAPLQGYFSYVNFFAYSKYFAVSEIAIAIIFLRISDPWIKFFGASICFVLLIFGMIIEKKQKQVSCNCFGSLSPTTSFGRLALRLSIAFSTVYLAIISAISINPVSGGIELQNNIQLFSITLAFLYALSLSGNGFSHIQNRTNSAADKPKSEAPAMRQFDRETFLGNQAGVVKTLEELAVPDQPLLIIFLSSNCQHCLELIPDLKGFVKGFSANLPIVLVTNEVGNEFDDIAHLCAVLSDKDRNLYRQIEAEVSPFGLLIHGTELKQMAPIAYGSDRIRLLFSMALNIR